MRRPRILHQRSAAEIRDLKFGRNPEGDGKRPSVSQATPGRAFKKKQRTSGGNIGEQAQLVGCRKHCDPLGYPEGEGDWGGTQSEREGCLMEKKAKRMALDKGESRRRQNIPFKALRNFWKGGAAEEKTDWVQRRCEKASR